MLENLGNIGDFLGGIGVVVTLIYLAIQIRQNTIQLYIQDFRNEIDRIYAELPTSEQQGNKKNGQG